MKIQHQLYVLILVLSFAISCTSETERSDQSKKVERAQEQKEQSIKKEVKTTVPLAQPKKVENKPKLFPGVQILRSIIDINNTQYQIAQLEETGDSLRLRKQDSTLSISIDSLDAYLKNLSTESPDYRIEDDWFLAYGVSKLDIDIVNQLLVNNRISLQDNPQPAVIEDIDGKAFACWLIPQNPQLVNSLVYRDKRYNTLTKAELKTIGVLGFYFRDDHIFKVGDDYYVFYIDPNYKISYFRGAVWFGNNSQKSNLMFDSIIKGDYGCALRMDTIVRLTENQSILICNIDGPEAGECGGALWMGKWTKPNSLERVYWKYYKELYLPYKVGITEDLNVQVYEPNRQKTVVDEFNLKDLLTDKRIYTED
ncbi:MAG: hypothetical protein NXI20_01845 [bacterium]|nr:hypothetical protein [bacterium]